MAYGVFETFTGRAGARKEVLYAALNMLVSRARGAGRPALGLAWRYLSARFVSSLSVLVAAAVYGPETFAVFGIYLALLNAVWIGVCLRYEAAILSAVDQDQLGRAVRLTLASGLTIWIIISLLACLAAFLGFMPGFMALLFSGSLAGRVGLRIAQALATRRGDFALLGKLTKVQSIVQPVVLLSLMLTPIAGVTVMAMADAIAIVAAALHMLGSQREALITHCRGSWAAKDLIRSARFWSELPLMNLPGSLLATGFAAAPLVILPMTVDPVVAGAAALAYRLLDIPTQIIGASCAPVLLNRLSSGAAIGRNTMHQGFIALLALISAVYGTIAIGALIIDPFLAETKWKGLADILPLMALFHAGLALIIPFSEAGSLYREQRLFTGLHGTAFAASVIILACLPLSPPAMIVSLSLIAWVRAACVIQRVVTLSDKQPLSFHQGSDMGGYAQT